MSVVTRTRAVILLLALVGLTGACSSGTKSTTPQATTSTSAAAPSSTTAPTAPNAAKTVWLCRPGLAEDPCTADLTATVVSASGAHTTAHPTAANEPPIDCFYVYPTVSREKTPNSDLVIGEDERAVAVAQASPFSQVCKVYAPMYRQVTLSALLAKGKTAPDRALAYADVANAWNDYLAHDNHGRGVVLIGHSQGAYMLTQLIQKEIDPDRTARALLVSALLIGGNVTVADGSDTGGSFKEVAACRSTSQVGCVVAYSAFSAEPPNDSLFGRSGTAGQHVLCVNPAGLGRGDGALQPAFPTKALLLGSGLKGSLADVTTPWVQFPSLFKAHCELRDGSSWLQIGDVRGAGDDRPRLADTLGPTWGLHLVDMNVAMGNLVELVRGQGAAWKP